MPGLVKPDFKCPECGRSVLLIFHEWSSSHDRVSFEYHHHEDAEKDRRGEEPALCRVTLPYDEGLARFKAESPA